MLNGWVRLAWNIQRKKYNRKAVEAALM